MSTTHQGGCHCGKVRYEVELDLGQPVISCNCSMCGRSGTLLAFVPEAKFKLLSGDDALTNYKFNNHIISHLFCATCGIKSFARGVGPDGSPVAAINARCLDGVDVKSLKVMEYDGAAM
jgi:hypothetical protein